MRNKAPITNHQAPENHQYPILMVGAGEGRASIAMELIRARGLGAKLVVIAEDQAGKECFPHLLPQYQKLAIEDIIKATRRAA